MDIGNLTDNISSWLSSNRDTLVSIAATLIVALIIKKFGDALIRKAVAKAVRPEGYSSRQAEKKRENTISSIISGALSLLVWPITGIIVASELGVNIAPLLAGVGVLGLAVGFGAQSLVKDVISGLFIIAENQYRVGDVVGLDAQTTGKIEKITLRTTVLRDLDGIVHHVPNGSIERTSNYSKDFSGINLDVGVGYDSDLKKVRKTVNEVGKELAKDKEWEDNIIEAPQFLRVENFGDSSIDIKITGKVKPLKQWDVAGELRERLKIAFDKEGIEIPFPQRVMHQR